MSQGNYWEAVEFIALNDEPGSSEALSVDFVKSQISVITLSVAFNRKVEKIAQDVIKIRRQGGPK